MPNPLRRSGLAEHAILWLLLLAAALALTHFDVLWRWDRLLYDAQLRLWSHPPADDMVIVAIDEASLAELGRWPWDRRLHAQLIERLDAAGARAIALDIIFAEPSSDDPGADTRLANALRRQGRSVLPVLVEQPRSGGQLIETLPIGRLAETAAGLGHVHVEIDPDGLVRSVYLKEGLGDAHWSNLGLALLEVADPAAARALPGARQPGMGSGSPMLWRRDHHMLIPFAGPPGHFPQISYARVLAGDFPATAFRDKLVLVGATAAGLGDALPTPLSGYRQPMSGVEINANIVDGLRRGVAPRPLDARLRLWLTGALVLLPALLFPRLSPRANLLVSFALIAGTLLMSLLWLQLGQVWFAPAPALLVLASSYPLWSWRRLEQAVDYLDTELVMLHEEQRESAVATLGDTRTALGFLTQVLPLRGWLLVDGRGARHTDGMPPDAPPSSPPVGHWMQQGGNWWTGVRDADGRAQVIGIAWPADSEPDAAQRRLLDELLQHETADSTPSGTLERVEQRILQVQRATHRLRELRHFISDSLAQMADGVLVVDAHGSVQLANARAALYLDTTRERDLIGRSLLEVLQALKPQTTQTWPTLLGAVLLRQTTEQVEARHVQGLDMLVQLSPLTQADHALRGLIVTLADISPLKASERRRAEVLGFLSHDLRSPLVSLLALLELARERDPNPAVLELMQRMEAQTDRTLALAEEFLQLAHAESGDTLREQDVDLVTVMHNALEQVWSQARTQSVQLSTDITVDTAWLRADAGLLERAVINLLNNAIKYSNPGTQVTLSLSRAADTWQCCVTDQGIGIAADDQARLFQRFSRIERPDQPARRGAGLGLALVKAVAERHGGRVEVTSRLGEGSRFCLCLPAAPDAAH